MSERKEGDYTKTASTLDACSPSIVGKSMWMEPESLRGFKTEIGGV